MKNIRFEKHYYKGVVSPFATSYEAVEFEFGDEIYITVEREHYLAVGHKTQAIKGKANMNDIEYGFDKKLMTKNFNLFAKDLKKDYKDDFFINQVPYNLSYDIVIVDGEEYKFSIYDSTDEAYYDLLDYIEDILDFISMPTKLLASVLSQEPFQKC